MLENSDPEIAETEQTLINRNIKTETVHHTLKKDQKYGKLLIRKKLTVNLPSQKGAPKWLSFFFLTKFNFSLNKPEIKDGLNLRYGWEPPNNPHTCPCGQPFTLAHSLHCPKGVYPHLGHNEIRDTFATILREVCHVVEIEPKLQSLKGESFQNKTTTAEDEARLDITAK